MALLPFSSGDLSNGFAINLVGIVDESFTSPAWVSITVRALLSVLL